MRDYFRFQTVPCAIQRREDYQVALGMQALRHEDNVFV